MSVLLMGFLAWQVLSTWQYFQTFSLAWVHNEISRLAKKKKNDEIQKIETFRTFQLFNVPSTSLACRLNFSGKLCNRSYEASCSCVPSPFLKYRCMDSQIWRELCLYIPSLITWASLGTTAVLVNMFPWPTVNLKKLNNFFLVLDCKFLQLNANRNK